MALLPCPSRVRPSLGALRFLRRAVATQHQTPASQSATRSYCHRAACSPRQTLSTNSTKHTNSWTRDRIPQRTFSKTARCAVELPSNPQTHYDFFPTTLPDGPPPAGAFKVDLKKLRNEFLKLQASAHPDRHPPERKAAAEALSSRINEAYKTLQSPLLRAQYLLSLRGDDSTTDDAAKLGEGETDQELLMEVLELREQIEDAETEDDIQGIKQENDVRIAGTVKELEDAFESDSLEDAAKLAVKLRYWVNVDDTCQAWEEGKPAPTLQH